jgi:hypothetical protein
LSHLPQPPCAADDVDDDDNDTDNDEEEEEEEEGEKLQARSRVSLTFRKYNAEVLNSGMILASTTVTWQHKMGDAQYVS